MNNSRSLANVFAGCMLVILIAAAGVSSASAQISLDNRASQGLFDATTANITGLTWGHTVNTCHNCVLYIGVTTFSNVPVPLPVATVTFTPSSTGVAVTATVVGNQLSPATNLLSNSSVQLYRIISPPQGIGTINVTSSPGVNYLFGSSFSFNGVNQTTPNGVWNSASGTSDVPGLVVAGDATGSVVLDILGSSPAALFFAPSNGQIVCTNQLTESTCTRGRRFFGGTFDEGAMSYKYAAGPGTVDNWVMTTADGWALGAVALTYDGTTAGAVSVEGQLLASDGRGVSGATVYAQDNKGNLLSAISNPFGYFTFEDLTAGETYILSANAKSYSFQPMIVTVNDSLTGVQLVALSPDPAGSPASTETDRPEIRPVGARPSTDRPVDER